MDTRGLQMYRRLMGQPDGNDDPIPAAVEEKYGKVKRMMDRLGQPHIAPEALALIIAEHVMEPAEPAQKEDAQSLWHNVKPGTKIVVSYKGEENEGIFEEVAPDGNLVCDVTPSDGSRMPRTFNASIVKVKVEDNG